MCARKIRIEITQLAVLIPPWNPRSRDQRLGPRSHLAIATGHAPVVDASRDHARRGFYGLPASSFTNWTNVRRSFDHLRLPAFQRFLLRLCTFRPLLRKAETSPSCVHPVNHHPHLWRALENVASGSGNPPPRAQFGLRGCETGFRRGFSQLTISKDGAQY